MPFAPTDTVAICNMALRHIAQASGITNFENDASEAADLCRVFFPQVVDEVLRAFPWPFATKFDSPALVQGPQPAPTPEWAYSYRVPVDCVWVRRILGAGTSLAPTPPGFPLAPTYPGNRIETQSSRIPYRLAADAAGRLLLTDFPPVPATTTTPQLPIIEYVFQQDNAGLYPADFAQAVALKLAFYMAPGLTKGDRFKLGDRAFSLYQSAIAAAEANAKNEEQKDMAADAEMIQARG